MNNKRLLNYAFLKDLINARNIDESDSEMVTKIMSACYIFSKIDFFDAYVRYDSFNSLTLTILVHKKDKNCKFNQIGVSYEVSDAKPMATLCIADIMPDTGAQGQEYKVVGKADIEYGTHMLDQILFQNFPKEYILEDNTDKFEKLIDKKVKEFANALEMWIVNEYSPTVQNWLEYAAGRKLDYVIEDGEDDGPECQSLKFI